MRLFRGFQSEPKATELGSGSSSGSHSDYSDSEEFSSVRGARGPDFNRGGISTRSRGHGYGSARSGQGFGGAMRNSPSAGSRTSAHAGSSGRSSPQPPAFSPTAASQGSHHLRSLSNGALLIPVGPSGGSLVPLRRVASSTNGFPGSTQTQHAVPATGPESNDFSASLRGLNASMAFSNYLANAAIEKKPTMNILVIGAPQVGKSMFINAYRAAVTTSLKWPTAPVGICGFYGTTSLEPFPNHPTEPSWMCIDTPGRIYTGESELLLEKMVEGMPWKTKLAGLKAMTLGEVKELEPIASNAAHQCIIVVPATDLIEDLGWTTVLRLQSRYAAAADAGQVVLYLKGLASLLRALLNDTAPFVLITKMDKVGGCNCYSAREAILALVGQCIPVNRVFFGAFPEATNAISFRQNLTLDPATRENLVQLHEEICFAVQWKRRVGEL